NALHRVEAGEIVGDRHADARRLAGGVAGHVHDAGFALDDGVVSRQLRVRPRVTVAGDRAVDQAGVDRRRGGVAEPELREAAGPEVLDQHVSRRDQAAQRLGAVRRLEIDRDALLAAVQREEEAALAADERRPRARVVAVLGLLDLQHLGAPVAELHRAERTGDDPRQIDDLHAVEWQHCARGSFNHITRAGPRAPYGSSRGFALITSSSTNTPTIRRGSARWTTGAVARPSSSRSAVS